MFKPNYMSGDTDALPHVDDHEGGMYVISDTESRTNLCYLLLFWNATNRSVFKLIVSLCWMIDLC